MSRYRWFHCEWPIPIDDVATLLMAKSFNHDTGSGFKIDKTRHNHISGKYLVKHDIEENVNDPLTGAVTTTQRTVYEVVNFNLNSIKPAIEVVDPPRSLSGFISALSDAIKTNITIINVSIDLDNYIELLRSNLKKTKVTMMDCSNIVINYNTNAKLTISSGDDVRPHLSELLVLRKHSIDKARITFMNNSGTHSWFDITSKGMAKIADRDAEDLLPILKGCISALN
jgi:hypothetical protein